jgi:hypothetical protein
MFHINESKLILRRIFSLEESQRLIFGGYPSPEGDSNFTLKALYLALCLFKRSYSEIANYTWLYASSKEVIQK